MKANEQWRNDPVKREQAKQRCSELVELYDTLASKLEYAEETMKNIKQLGEELPNSWNQFRSTSFKPYIEEYRKKSKNFENPTDTLIGNMAAFGKGN